MPAPYPDKQHVAREALKKLFAVPSMVRVIHYSSESFDNRERSPRVTSIAVRNLQSGQTESYSIHAIGEEQGIDPSQIDTHYDDLEKVMLERFYEVAGQAKDADYIHWNMRDANYGFTALEHRLRVLKGKPGYIPEAHRFDLARLLQDMYGNEYIGNPKLRSLAEKNEMTLVDFLDGAVEVERFKEKDYVGLHRSTLRKADVIADIAERAYRRTLRTNASWWVERGGTIAAVASWLWNNPGVSLTVGLVGTIGTIIGLVACLHH